MADMQVGQMIGEGDAVANRPYSYTVVCRSLAGEVFEIKKEVGRTLRMRAEMRFFKGFYDKAEEERGDVVTNY